MHPLACFGPRVNRLHPAPDTRLREICSAEIEYMELTRVLFGCVCNEAREYILHDMHFCVLHQQLNNAWASYTIIYS